MFSACKKEEATPEKNEPYVGTFTVKETSPTKGPANYSVTITKSATESNKLEIANFADVIKKKVLADVTGNNITISSQTFVAGKSHLIITGTGVITGNTLNLTYAVTGDFKWDAVCVLTKL